MTPGPDYAGENLLFVAGCPRSGTTWVQRLLSCHPAIHTGQETHIFNHYLMPVETAWRRSKAGSPRGVGLAGYFSDEQFHQVLKSFLVSLLSPLVAPLAPGEFFLEKTPSNALFMPEITGFLPAARIIHVLRDPRDVVASLLAASRSWGRRWAPRNARRAITTWKEHVGGVREASRNLPPSQFMEIRYEDLHADPERVLRSCITFLGLEWSDEQLRSAISANEPEKAVTENGGTPIPIGGELGARFGGMAKEPKGFIRKAKVGSWKQDLNPADKFWIWMLARKQMTANGYPWRSAPK
ncbi:MAG: sulfotransferase [Candidatus Eremiobacteraeota bacterium]|nr:sulfotransferase [Candidatus Eremiobacteraeota bacterium]MBC5803957.1 sulfotransferase [Candidatus Eremiobacteraeota bacterium]MBC5824949.1 sulfotransferase [Candidatus Eremiobacteraeota bacterium]